MEMVSDLSNESFSYSWLANIKPTMNSVSCSEAQKNGTFVEMNNELRSVPYLSDDFDFDFSLPASLSPIMVHADELFSDGILLPLHLIAPTRAEVTSEAKLRRSFSLDSSKRLISNGKRYHTRYLLTSNSSPSYQSVERTPISLSSRSIKLKLPSFTSCMGPPKKNFGKYLCFLMPVYEKMKLLRLFKKVAGSRVSSMRRCKEYSGTCDTDVYGKDSVGKS